MISSQILKIVFLAMLVYGCVPPSTKENEVDAYFNFVSNSINLKETKKIKLIRFVKNGKFDNVLSIDTFDVAPVLMQVQIGSTPQTKKDVWSVSVASPYANMDTIADFDYELILSELNAVVRYSEIKLDCRDVYRGRVCSIDSVSINGELQKNENAGNSFEIK